jgi:UDP-glucose 4-epimerase
MQTPSAVGQVFNIGSDQPIAIRDLAARVIEVAGSRSTIQFQSYSEAYDRDFEDIRHRVPDLARIRATIGYQPKSDLDAILRDVVAWKRNHPSSSTGSKPAPGAS